MNSMKQIILFLLLTLAGTQLTAQRDYDDLLELLVDEKYDRCLRSAEKYTLSDDTKKDPLPYLYYSMAMLRIHQGDDVKMKEFVDNKGFKESLKYASKYSKKDKQKEYYAEFTDYFVELRQATYEEAEIYDSQEKFTKSKGLYKYLTVIDSQDPGGWMYRGYTEWALKARRDAGESWTSAKEIMSEKGIDHLEEDQKKRLMMALINVSEYLDGVGETSQAREFMEIGKAFFGDDDSYMVTYSDIVG